MLGIEQKVRIDGAEREKRDGEREGKRTNPNPRKREMEGRGGTWWLERTGLACLQKWRNTTECHIKMK